MKTHEEIARPIALEHPSDGRGSLSSALVRAGKIEALRWAISCVEGIGPITTRQEREFCHEAVSRLTAKLRELEADHEND
jgi:phage FluMu protein gp41